MKIRQTNINLIYPKVLEYRKKFIDAEDALRDSFMPATILSVPDEVQDEVPRAIAQSKHGHSVLSIALTASSLTTMYTDDFVNDWDLCERYLGERCDSLYKLVNKLSGPKQRYVGLVTCVEFDDINESSLNILKKSLFKDNGDQLGNLFGTACKFIYIVKNRYYINLTLETTRQNLIQTCPSDETGEQMNFVAVTIDVNDRYIANQSIDYESSKEAFDEILQITTNIINGKLDELIKRGRFEYVEK